MPPMKSEVRNRPVVAALAGSAIVLWLASFVAIIVDGTSPAWKWLALAAIVALAGMAVVTLVEIWRDIRRGRT